jgi:hypothetical protein
MAVLAILSADLVSRSNYSGPYRSCGSLRNSLRLEGCFALGRKLLIHLLDRLLDADGIQVAVQLRLDASWMYRRGAYALPSMTRVESNGEEDIRSLGPADGDSHTLRERCFSARVYVNKVDGAGAGRGENAKIIALWE